MSTETFRGHAVVITGASRGIGRALAEQLADGGARLALASRDADTLADVAEACRRRGAEAIAVPTDVACPQQCRTLISRAAEHFGRLDMLVNNAGVSQVANLADMPNLDILERIVRVNFHGAAYCTYHALPHLLASGGRIVAVSSVKGRIGAARSTAYCASKHAMTGFFDALRAELRQTSVSVTVVYAGLVATDMPAHVVDVAGRPLGKRGRRVASGRKMMSASTCARHIFRAAARRRRECVLTPAGKAAVWLRLLAPGILDYFVRRTFRAWR